MLSSQEHGVANYSSILSVNKFHALFQIRVEAPIAITYVRQVATCLASVSRHLICLGFVWEAFFCHGIEQDQCNNMLLVC